MVEQPEPIARFKAQLVAFTDAGLETSACTLTFPNVYGLPDVLWHVHGALGPGGAGGPGGAAAARRAYAFHPGDVVELTERDDGLLTTSVDVGNYGPPETRHTYSLRVGDQACVWTCDDVDFNLPTLEITFRVAARSADLLEQVVTVLVDWHTARGAALVQRTAGRD